MVVSSRFQAMPSWRSGLTEPRGGSDAADLALSARRKGDWLYPQGRSLRSVWPTRPTPLCYSREPALGEQGARCPAPSSCRWTRRASQALRYNDLGSRASGRSSIFRRRRSRPRSVSGRGCGFCSGHAGFRFQPGAHRPAVVGSARASRRKLGLCPRAQGIQTPPKNQGVIFPLAEAETLVSATRQLCYHTLALKDAGKPHTAKRPCANGSRRRQPSTSPTSVPADARSLWLVARSAASATPARMLWVSRSATGPRES